MALLSDLISGFFGNASTDKAADASIDASKRANETMLEMFNRSNQITGPNQQAGWNALAMQGSLLGNSNLVPQSAINTALAASGAPGATSVWGSYLQANPDVAQAFNPNSPHIRNLGISTPEEWAEYHYNTTGRNEGRQLPTGSSGQPGQLGASSGIGVGTSVDDAYNTFLGSGFGRSALETTNNDYQQLVGAFGAGGKSMSGSAIGALNDRNRRNTQGAFGNYYNALSGISGTGAQIGQQQAGAANQVGSNVAQNQQQMGRTRASSYLTQGQNNANMVNSGVNALASWFGGQG
jgi:hypothetical protein